ncbi:hypothetical protein ACIRH0_03990 [Streptomyces sp. NPDC093675]|uniref:hypothetical protein n=1 Tax=Streptomyces sp. NPDC093675 TaxID=3366049 RepID=UPI00382CD364
MTELPERPRDWLDDILEIRTPSRPADPPTVQAVEAEQPTEVEDQDDEEPARWSLWSLLATGKSRGPRESEQPACSHPRTEPVYAQPTGELVALLCLVCDEQLDPPLEDEGEPEAEPSRAPEKRKPGRKGTRAPLARRPNSRVAVSTSHLRAIAFTGSAAAFGYSTGLVGALGGFLPAADHGATGTVGAVLAFAAAFGAWRVLGYPGVAVVLPYPLVSRILVTALVASSASSVAPDVVAWLNRYGHLAGLDGASVSLLAAAASLCGGLYWIVDRRFRHVWWPVRWLARVPLASALLAVALYAPGPR